jgi:CBS domain-containing protein
MSADGTMKDSVKAVLEKVKVGDLPKPPSLIEFTTTDNLTDSFSTLIQAKILSAPVFDAEKKEYIGFLDLRDLVSYVIHAEKAKANKHFCLKDIVANVPLVSDVEVTISYLARRHRIQMVSQDSTLYDVAKLLCTRLHRVPVIGDDGKIVNIVSQSVIIKHISQHLKDLSGFAGLIVKDVKVGSSPVLQVKSETSAITAFDLLDTHGRFGIAVTGQEDAILTQTCAGDLKLWLQKPSSQLLDLPVMKFLQIIRANDDDIQVPVLATSEKDTLSHVIQKLEATRQHRIYVVDAKFTPNRVISLTDLLRFCITE